MELLQIITCPNCLKEWNISFTDTCQCGAKIQTSTGTSAYPEPPLPNCLPDDDAIKAKIKSLGWEVDGTAESNDMIELAKWMRSLAEKEIIGFAEWIDSKGAYRNFNYNPVIWQMKGDYKHYTTSELLTKYRESCLKQ